MRMRLKSHAPGAFVQSARGTRPSLQHSRCRRVPVGYQISSFQPRHLPEWRVRYMIISCFIRWRYFSLGSGFYFCLIPRDFGPGCGRRLWEGLRRHWSQAFAMLLGAVSDLDTLDADSTRGRRSAVLDIGRGFYNNDTQSSAEILLTSHSLLRFRTLCVACTCDAAAGRHRVISPGTLIRLNDMFHGVPRSLLPAKQKQRG